MTTLAQAGAGSRMLFFSPRRLLPEACRAAVAYLALACLGITRAMKTWLIRRYGLD